MGLLGNWTLPGLPSTPSSFGVPFWFGIILTLVLGLILGYLVRISLKVVISIVVLIVVLYLMGGVANMAMPSTASLMPTVTDLGGWALGALTVIYKAVQIEGLYGIGAFVLGGIIGFLFSPD